MSAEFARKTNRVVSALVAPVCARAHVQANVTRVERTEDGHRTPHVLWTYPSWLNIVRVDEHGDNLLVEALPQCVLPEGAGSDLVVLQLYAHGELRRNFTLSEVCHGAEGVEWARTVGAWGHAIGSPESGKAQYLLPSGRTLVVDLASASLTLL